MQNEFDLVRRAMKAFWGSIDENAFKQAHEPLFTESFVDKDMDSGRVYIALKDGHGNFVKCYRHNTNKQLVSLERIPKFMRQTNQTTPLY